MRLLPFTRAILPSLLLATSMLVPGVLRAAPRGPKQKATTKASTASSAAKKAPKQKTTRKVSTRRVTRRRTYRVRASSRPSADRIKQIQQALARSGFYQGDPSGRWDSATIEAMKNFQQAHGLPSTGKIDATSLQQLGLGSDIAGLAPPRPLIAATHTDGGGE